MATEAIAPPGDRDGLLERGAELARIGAAARAAAGGAGGALVVEGPAGIGKTALLGAARSCAGAAGLAVLSARGAPLEREFGFGVARQALEPAVAELDGAADAVFRGPARLAAPLLGAEPPGVAPAVLPVGPDAAFAAVHALGALVANLTRRRPVALLVDDAHWADGPSLRLLAFLAARAAELPLLLVVAARPAGEPGAAPAGRLLTDGIAAVVLRPRPLSADAAARVIRASLPDAGADACQACHRAAGGNPFYLRELAGALAESGTARAADVERVVPDGVAAAVGARLARLSDAQRRLCRAVAVLGDEVPLRRAAPVTGLNAEAASQAADELRVAGILTPARALTFVHPLLRTAIETAMLAGALAAAHARAARLLWEDGEAAERIAAHLLAAEPAASAWACERLLSAARQALRRGAPEAAISHLRRALLEPPPPERRAEVLVELGSAEVLALQWATADEHLRAGMHAAADPNRRLGAALMLSAMLGSDGRAHEAVALLDEALRHGDGADPALVARLEGHLVNVARLRIDTYPRVRTWSARVRRRIEAGADASVAELAAVCADMVMAGEPRERAVALAQRMLAAAPPLPSMPGDFSALMIVRCLVVADRFDLAERAADALVDAAERHGAAFYACAAKVFRSDARMRRGALELALEGARDGLATFGESWVTGVPAALSVMVNARVDRGELAEADAAIGEAGLDLPADAMPPDYSYNLLLHARGRLRWAQRRPAAALEDLLGCGRRQEAIGEPNPALIDWRSGAALACHELGDAARARSLVAEELEGARAFGAPRAIGIALRASALVDAGARALGLLTEAVEVLERSGARVEHARALTDLGRLLYGAGDVTAARQRLSAALELAHECGAWALERRALRELHATGARPRRPVRHGALALTPGERRVAEMAARGLSNRQIAEELVVTTRTVEFHLSGAYRKLEIRSRDRLADALRAST